MMSTAAMLQKVEMIYKHIGYVELLKLHCLFRRKACSNMKNSSSRPGTLIFKRCGLSAL
jgi:hypothetical protein